MSGGTLCKVSVGRAGGASNNALYITRASAVTDRENGVLIRHIDEAIDSRDFAQLRTDISSYFWAREEVELTQERKNTAAGRSDKVQAGKRAAKARQTRTHYRVILSFEREVETEKAKAMVNEWLDKTPFRDAPAVAAIHRDTDHPHAHVHIDARQVSGKKVDLSPREFRTLDEVWNEIYCREFGLDEGEHLAKKAEMRKYKRAVLKAKREGMPPPERPSRSEFPERDRFANREARENKSIASDETWSAGRRFDLNVRRIERRIKNQFDVRYQLKRQLNPLAQIEGRVRALRRLGELVYDSGKGLHDAYQRRVAIRESIAQGGSGDIAEASARSGAGAQADASRVRTIEGGDQRGSNREGAGRSVGRAITGEAEPITAARRSGASERATSNSFERGAEHTEDPGTAHGEARVGARAGQARSEGEFHLDSENYRRGAAGAERNAQSAQEITAPTRENHYTTSRLSVSGPTCTAASKGARVDYPGDEFGSRAGTSLESNGGDPLGTTGANRARDSIAKQENSSVSETIGRNSPGDLRAGDVVELSTWSDGIPDPSLNDSVFDFLRPEPQGLPFTGTLNEGVGREVQTGTNYTDSGLPEGICGRGDSLIADVVESGALGVWSESDGRGQASSNIDPVGADDSLRVEWGVDEKCLQSSLLDTDLRERLAASNDALLESVKQSELTTIQEPAGQVIETEAESAEVADSAPIIDIFL